ncbi:hypothetical protein FJZ28_02145 [Candidatus Peregrinibacteria bacterium]|nr:hypothetical protein [Candidatus Peregrinibacteria bacterium]
MKQSFTPLRLVLALVCTGNLSVAYLFFFSPDVVSSLFRLPPPTEVQQYLTMTIGALIGVFGVGGLLPLFKPLKYGAIIWMLLLMHFSIFLIDVVVLSRGLMDWKIVVPEMLYFLLVSTALVRWYPLGSIEGTKKEELPLKQS